MEYQKQTSYTVSVATQQNVFLGAITLQLEQIKMRIFRIYWEYSAVLFREVRFNLGMQLLFQLASKLIVTFHTETNHLIYHANQITGFQMECNTGLKWVKAFHVPCIIQLLGFLW